MSTLSLKFRFREEAKIQTFVRISSKFEFVQNSSSDKSEVLVNLVENPINSELATMKLKALAIALSGELISVPEERQ